MPLKLIILVGTMTGTAQLVAQELQLTWEDEDTQVELLPMDALDAGVFSRECIFLVSTSAYGQGDVPDNPRKLYAALCRDKPDLAHVRYGVFGLGDRTYAETFNFGGKRFDDVLAELGAKRIGERVQHNASSGEMPEDTALEWAPQWLALAREAAEQIA